MLTFIQNRYNYIKKNGLRSYVALQHNRIKNSIFSILDIPLQKLFGERYLHWRSQKFWLSASNNYRGSKEYYDRQEVALKEFLAIIDCPTATALDIGCGDGRFTFVMGQVFSKVFGFDISEQLVAKAKEHANAMQASNVTFETMDLTKNYPTGHYDLVSCMGVTAAIVSEDAFLMLIKNLYSSVSPASWLITKDTLSEKGAQRKFNGSYVATYRSRVEYEQKFVDAGFNMVQKILLADNHSLGTKNYIYLWKK